MNISRDNISHSQDPACHPVRIERLEVLHLLADTDELDRLAYDLSERERGSTTGVRVELGKDNTADSHLLLELLCDCDGVLTGHGICDEQCLIGLDGCVDIHQLQVLGEQVGVPVYAEPDSKDAPAVALNAFKKAKREQYDVLIVDTSGRMYLVKTIEE